MTPRYSQSPAYGAQVLEVERLRSLGTEPCLLETIVLPLPLFGKLAESDTDAWDDLLYPMFQKRCGVVVHKTQDNLSFSQLNAAQAPDGQCKFPRLWPPQTPPGKDSGIMTGRC